MEKTKEWPEPTTPRPSFREVERWMVEDGGCQATDGCWVEEDGWCVHGHASWVLYFGYDFEAFEWSEDDDDAFY